MGIDLPAKDATAEEKKAAQTAALAAGLKKLAEVTEKCKEPKDKAEECMKKAGEDAKMCMMSCALCTNYDSASALVLGAAAVATAMLLI